MRLIVLTLALAGLSLAALTFTPADTAAVDLCATFGLACPPGPPPSPPPPSPPVDLCRGLGLCPPSVPPPSPPPSPPPLPHPPAVLCALVPWVCP